MSEVVIKHRWSEQKNNKYLNYCIYEFSLVYYLQPSWNPHCGQCGSPHEILSLFLFFSKIYIPPFTCDATKQLTPCPQKPLPQPILSRQLSQSNISAVLGPTPSDTVPYVYTGQLCVSITPPLQSQLSPITWHVIKVHLSWPYIIPNRIRPRNQLTEILDLRCDRLSLLVRARSTCHVASPSTIGSLNRRARRTLGSHSRRRMAVRLVAATFSRMGPSLGTSFSNTVTEISSHGTAEGNGSWMPSAMTTGTQPRTTDSTSRGLHGAQPKGHKQNVDRRISDW